MQATLNAIEAKNAAMEAELQRQSAMIEKKKRIKAMAAEKLQAETDHYLAVARAAEAEAALAKERMKQGTAAINKHVAHAKEVEEYNLKHQGKVNVHVSGSRVCSLRLK